LWRFRKKPSRYATFAPPLGSAHRERGIGTGKFRVKTMKKNNQEWIDKIEMD